MSFPVSLPRRRALQGASALLAGALIVGASAITNPAIGQSNPDQVPYEDVWGPTGMPDRVALSPTDDPTTSQAVSWRSSTDVETPTAEITEVAPGPGFKNYGGRSGQDDVTTISGEVVGDVDEDLHYPMRFHTATFEGLEPGTDYMYRVGDGSGHNRTNWSEWFEFTTPDEGDDEFSFIYYGDAQNDMKEHASRVFRRAFGDRPDAELLLHAGDLINYGDRDYEWGEWFYMNGFTTGQINQLATPGNHEYFRDTGSNNVLNAYWDKQFSFPDNGPTAPADTEFPEVYENLDNNNVHYVDYKNARFISLDSNGSAVSSGAPRQEWFDAQAEWLDQVLEENTQEWTVLYFHHPIFSVSTGRNNQQLREAWLPVVEKHNVDVVLQGHDHTYGRGNVVDERLGNSYQHQGTTYAVSVSGPKMYDVSGQVWDDNGADLRQSGQDVQLYQLIDIEGDNLVYNAYTAGGDWHDGFEINKRPNDRKIVRDIDENGRPSRG